MWSKEVPKKEGWYWIRYEREKGDVVKCPCLVVHFKDGDYLVRTAHNVAFSGNNRKYFSMEGARFGPEIVPPPEE